MYCNRSTSRRSRSVAALLVLLLMAGCGNRLYPVRGTVTLEDGTPLTKGLVVFEGNVGGAPIMARGEVQADGTYQLGTYQLEDGVPPGRYRVLVNPMDHSDVPDERKNLPFDIKYLRYDTSGLEYEVKAGRNEFSIKLARSQKGRR
jgi:hypothetical protein